MPKPLSASTHPFYRYGSSCVSSNSLLVSECLDKSVLIDVGSQIGWLFGFYDISIFVGYLMPNNQFYFEQVSLAWVHSLIVKNISISSYSV